jgi:hypothetical protein
LQALLQAEVVLHKISNPHIGEIDLALASTLALNKYLSSGKVQIVVTDCYGFTYPNSCSHQERHTKKGCRFDRSYEVNLCAAQSGKTGLAGEMRE